MNTNSTKLTSNEFYGKLNARFDTRAAKLAKAGFKYRIVCKGVAVFTRTTFNQETNIAAGSVLNASRLVWADMLKTLNV